MSTCLPFVAEILRTVSERGEEPVPLPPQAGGSVRQVQGTRRRRLDALTFGLFAVALGTNVPTPLLLVYRRTLDLSEADLTAIFGCYAVGLIAALSVAGAASDRFGRRTLVLPFEIGRAHA